MWLSNSTSQMASCSQGGRPTQKQVCLLCYANPATWQTQSCNSPGAETLHCFSCPIFSPEQPQPSCYLPLSPASSKMETRGWWCPGPFLWFLETTEMRSVSDHKMLVTSCPIPITRTNWQTGIHLGCCLN